MHNTLYFPPRCEAEAKLPEQLQTKQQKLMSQTYVTCSTKANCSQRSWQSMPIAIHTFQHQGERKHTCRHLEWTFEHTREVPSAVCSADAGDPQSTPTPWDPECNPQLGVCCTYHLWKWWLSFSIKDFPLQDVFSIRVFPNHIYF